MVTSSVSQEAAGLQSKRSVTEYELLAWGRANLAAFRDGVAAIPTHDCKSTSGRRHVGDAYRSLIQQSHMQRLAAGLTIEQAKNAIARAYAVERDEMILKGWSGDTVSGWHLKNSIKGGVTYGEAVREQRRMERMRDVQVEVAG